MNTACGHIRPRGRHAAVLAAFWCLFWLGWTPQLCAQSETPAEVGTGAVLVLDTPASEALIPARTLAAYLSADLAPHGLQTAVLSVDSTPLFGSDLDAWLLAHPDCAAAPALLWVAHAETQTPDSQPQTAADNILLLTVAFPQSRLIVQRQFPHVNGRPPAFAPLSAIAAAMIAAPLREQQARLDAVPKTADTPEPQPSLSPAESAPPADFVPTAERPTQARPIQRLTLDAIPIWQSHPTSGDQFLGAALLLAYSPQPPLALLIGGGALADTTLTHPRYRLSLLHAPLTAGGRFYKLFGPHAVEVDASILAQLGHLRFSDRMGVVPDTQATRVNVGFLAALSYVYNPLPSLGVGMRAALGFTPRVQRYLVDDEPVAEPGAWFVQLGFILRWDALR